VRPSTELAEEETAEPVMASNTATSLSQAADGRESRPGLLQEFRTFLHKFAGVAFDPYRPELHYMRGPGPAWRAKHAASATPGSELT
jgi:hypothetical protein